MSKSTLNVVLGAGFSFHAKLPMASKIAARFNRDNCHKLLRQSSSEWEWIDGKSDAVVNNGKLNFDCDSYSYILNEILIDYLSVKSEFTNYEDFFQFILNKKVNKEWQELVFGKAKENLLNNVKIDESNEYQTHYLSAFKNVDYEKIIDIINYLIADMLYLNVKDSIIIEHYTTFINFILRYDKVNIFTLNHDLLMERIFKLFNVKYCDGFSKVGSNLFHDSTPQSRYVGYSTTLPINLFKLHGSVDMYRYDHFNEMGSGGILSGYYDYFKPDDSQAKHYTERKDVNGVVVQKMHFNNVPRFITGTQKDSIIESDIMYSELYTFFRTNMSEDSDYLIIGYSYGDEHINSILKNATPQMIININPNIDYPFDNIVIKDDLKDILELK